MKPDNYLLVWAQIFSKLENAEGTMFIYELTGRNNIPKPTLKRILDYGTKYDDFNLEYKWRNNVLIFRTIIKTNEIKKKIKVKEN